MSNENLNRPAPSGNHPVKKVKKKKPVENTSGMGERATIPSGIKSFNWGAFFFTWLWGIFNKTYITLLFLLLFWVPLVNLGLIIWFGLKGNEWAWKNKHWKGVAHFNDVQKKWAIAGVVLMLISIAISVLSFGSLTAMLFSGAMNGSMTPTMTAY